MALNLRAPFFLVAGRGAASCDEARGAIVNIADLAAFETWPGYLPHGISKSGVVHLTRALARVLAPEVRVGGDRAGHGAAAGGLERGGRRAASRDDAARSATAARRTSSTTVLFILDSDYLTGETIIVDGGRHVRH